MSARRFCYSQIISAKNSDEIKQNAGWNQFATLNDDALGRTLDTLYTYGATELYRLIAAGAPSVSV